MSAELQKHAVKDVSDRSLRQYRQFYLTYLQIWQTPSAKFNLSLIDITPLTETGKTNYVDSSLPPLGLALLLGRLTYSHFVELLKVDDPLSRRFYEVQAFKNNWKVHRLNRAVTTLLAGRNSLSTDKAAVIARTQQNQPAVLEDLIRNPYLLEFLGLQEKPEYSENDLETAIIDHLQDYLLKLGRGLGLSAHNARWATTRRLPERNFHSQHGSFGF